MIWSTRILEDLDSGPDAATVEMVKIIFSRYRVYLIDRDLFNGDNFVSVDQVNWAKNVSADWTIYQRSLTFLSE